MRDGFLVVFDPSSIVGEAQAVKIPVRAGRITDPYAVNTALQKYSSLRRDLGVGRQTVELVWRYTPFFRPSPQKVKSAIEGILVSLRDFAKPLVKCDKCAATSSLYPFVLGNEASYLCPACRQRIVDEIGAFEARCEAVPVRMGWAILTAGVLCLLGGETLFRLFRSDLWDFFWAATVLGALIGAATAVAAGKSTLGVKSAAYGSSFAAVWIAIIRSVDFNDSGTTPKDLGAGPLFIAVMKGLWLSWAPLIAARFTLNFVSFRLVMRREENLHTGAPKFP